MSKKQELIDRIMTAKLISIIRLNEQSAIQPAIDALVAGGVKVLEVTTNTPGFAEEVAMACKRHPDILIGVGTVMNTDLAKRAIAGGAQFLVTPNTNEDVAKLGRADNIPVLMGALTPTEVANAQAYGADIIKLFPAGDMGIPYFKSLKGPFDAVPFFAVGGVNQENIGDWIDAGAKGIGLGSNLVKSDVSTKADFEEITALAQKFLSLLAD